MGRFVIEYLIYRAAMLISLCTPLRFAYWVGRRFADLHYVFDRRGRRAVKDNLRRVLGGSERMIGYEARWTFRHFGKYLAEFFRFSRLSSTLLEKHLLVEGAENLAEAHKVGKGVIILTAHLGNWELGSLMLRSLGYEITSVALDHKNKRVNDLLNRYRAQRGVEILPAGGFLRGCYRALKKGRLVALLGDRDVTGGGIEMQFFGAPVSLPQGPARLSVRTGAPIVPAFLLRRPNDSWHGIIGAPIFPEAKEDLEEAVQSLMKRYIPVMEYHIRWHPSQWAIFYDFWNAESG
jgi:lauroyl/myristoyl acyltransferase